MLSNSFWTRTAATVVAIGGLGLLAAGGASAQATTDGDVTAEILSALSVSQTTAFDFGQSVASAAAGTVVVTNAGAKSCTGGASCVGSTAQQGVFSVSGQALASVDISFPNASETLTQDSLPNTATMTMGTFVDSQGGTFALDVTGAGSFNVGATLNVGANQTVDTYTGTYTVNVDYN